jgi:hypothetical protein
MSTWRPPLGGAGQFAVTLLPPTRANNSITARRPPGPDRRPRSVRAHRALCTPRPARRSGLAGRGPARQPTMRTPGAEPSGHAQAPCPTTAPSTHDRRTRAGFTDPTRPPRTRPGGGGRGREEFALLGCGNHASMAVLRRNGRRRAAGADPMVRAFGETRTCAEGGCPAQLSRYNPARRCAIHQGWDRQVVTRPRRRHP